MPHRLTPRATAAWSISSLALGRRGIGRGVVHGGMVVAENRFWNHAVHTLTDVDNLRDATIADDGGERIGFLMAHRDDGLRSQPLDGLLDRDLHRLIQILVETGEYPVGLGLRPGPIGFQILAHDGLNLDLLVCALERREIDLTVALAAVGIAGPDQSAFLKYVQIENGTHLQLVQVHVRAVLPGPQRAGTAFGVV